MIDIETLSIIISISIIISLISSTYIKKLFVYIYREYRIKKQFIKIINSKPKYKELLFEIAFQKVRSGKLENKLMGLEQLYELTDEKNVNIVYDELIEILKSENDKISQKILIKTLCRINNKKFDSMIN